MDKVIWLSKENASRFISFFARPMFTTLQVGNLIAFSVNGGLTLRDPLSKLDNDTFGLGMGVARVSNSVSAYDWDLRVYDPAVYTPVRSTEISWRRPIRFRSRPGGRSSPTSSISSIPAPGSPTPTIQRGGSRTNS